VRARTAAHTSPSSRFIEPAVLARISNLELLARTVVEGFIAGLHRSPFVGFSLDFAAHRAYMPGDDIRRIDWRLYARSDRFYVKEYEAETNANVFIALDISRSMDFGTAGVTKLDYGRYLGASLAYMAREQRDRVGLCTFDRDLIQYIPPSASHRRIVLHAIDRIEAGGEGELVRPLSRVAESLRRRGLIVLVSDLYAEPQTVGKAIDALRGGGHDVMVFQLLDPAELAFPYESPMAFEDLETGDRIPVTPDAVQEEYLRLIGDHGREISRIMRERRVDHAIWDISQPLDGALFAFLSLRARRLRTR